MHIDTASPADQHKHKRTALTQTQAALIASSCSSPADQSEGPLVGNIYTPVAGVYT